MRALARIFAGLTALAALAAGAVLLLLHGFSAPGPLTQETVVQIPRGAGLSVIAGRLEDAGVVEDRWIFISGVMLERRERSLKAGEYAFAPGISAEGVMDLLSSGRTISYTVTVRSEEHTSELQSLMRN